MRSMFLFTAVFCLIAATAVTALAEAGQADAVYVLDMQKTIDGSDIGKSAKERMDKEIKKQELELEKKKADIDRMKADLVKQASLLSPEAAAEKRTQLEQKARDLQRGVDDARQGLTRRNGAEIEKVVREVDIAVKELSRERGYKIVVERDPRFVLYVADRYDLTKEVVEHLNDKDIKLD